MCTFILISGKRSCGKDYFRKLILQNLDAIFIQPSTELKKEYAEARNLDFNKLMTDREYKESHRCEMTKFFEKNIAEKGESYYILKSMASGKEDSNDKIYITDVRLRFEIDQYKSIKNSRVVSIRISTKDEVREKRGWKFNQNIDTNRTETDLDCYQSWDLVVDNNEDGKEHLIKVIKDQVLSLLKQ